MIFFAVLLAVKWLAFIGACALTGVALILAISRSKHRARNIALTLTAGSALVAGLCRIPQLDYYIGYGIQTQAVLNTKIIETCLAVPLVSSLFVSGYRKWISVAAVICGYLAFAIF